MAKGKQIYTCDDELNFGKYRGRTVAWVLQKDPQYFQWCLQNIAWVDTDPATEVIMNEALAQVKDKRSSGGYTRRDGVEYSSPRRDTRPKQRPWEYDDDIPF